MTRRPLRALSRPRPARIAAGTLLALCVSVTRAQAPAVQPPAPAASMPVYAIDPTHTFAQFEVRHRGLSTQRGRVDRKSGEVRLDRAARRAEVDLTLVMDTLNTGVQSLDALLRGPAYFDAARHPQARFQGIATRWDGDQPVVFEGRLTLRGQTHPVALTATRFHCYLNPLFRREVCGGDYTATLQPSRWGLALPEPWASRVPDEVGLVLQVEAIRQ